MIAHFVGQAVKKKSYSSIADRSLIITISTVNNSAICIKITNAYTLWPTIPDLGIGAIDIPRTCKMTHVDYSLQHCL